jgi:hypothetical protein
VTLELHRTELPELDAVANLLLSAFNAPPGAAFADLELLRWKYFEPGPQWQGSRSYVMRKDDLIHAHCAVWPLNLHFAGKEISCLCYIDWANRSDLPGAGFMLKKKLMKLSDTSIVVGGSAETREIVPRLGFVHVSEVESFGRVVRPWKQYRSRPAEAVLKGAARFARNASWSFFARSVAPKNWSAERIESFSSPLNDDVDTEHPTTWRDAGYLNFWLRCPASTVSAYEMRKDGNGIGYFLLSLVGGQARIADIRINSRESEDWQAAYGLAANTAAEHPETCEILAVASTKIASESLKADGFRYRGGSPLFLYDPEKKLAGCPPLFWNMIDGDAAYLHDPAFPYVT